MFFALGSSRLHLQGCQAQRPQSLLPPSLIDSVGRKRGPSPSPPPLSSSTVDMETRQRWEEKRGGGGSVSTSVIKNTCLMPPSSSSQRAGGEGGREARREAEAVLSSCSSPLVPFFSLFSGPGFRSSTCGTLVVVYSTQCSDTFFGRCASWDFPFFSLAPCGRNFVRRLLHLIEGPFRPIGLFSS